MRDIKGGYGLRRLVEIERFGQCLECGGHALGMPLFLQQQFLQHLVRILLRHRYQFELFTPTRSVQDHAPRLAH